MSNQLSSNHPINEYQGSDQATGEDKALVTRGPAGAPSSGDAAVTTDRNQVITVWRDLIDCCGMLTHKHYFKPEEAQKSCPEICFIFS